MLLYLRIAWFNFSTVMAYPFELLASLLRPFIGIGFQLIFWSIVAASAPNSFEIRPLIAYFLIANGVTTLILANDFKFGSYLAKSIKYGTINSQLIRPVSVPRYALAEVYGRMGIRCLVGVAFIIAGLTMQPPYTFIGSLLFIVLLIEAACVSYGLNILIGTIAFYTPESGGVKNVFSHISSVFSGLIVPLALFPTTLKSIALWLPFAAIAYAPTSVLGHGRLVTNPIVSLVSGALWSIVLITLSGWWWKRSLRRYDAIGL